MGNEESRGMAGPGGAPASPEQLRQMQAKGIRIVDKSLQRKLQQGGKVYNMKVVIRGDEGVGKTSLLCRLQGRRIPERHVATPDLQCAHINWNYKATDDVIKVEVWDAVDASRVVVRAERSEPTSPEQVAAAMARQAVAETAGSEVYKGTHAVVMMVDPTRRWTFEYAEKELKAVPEDMAVLLLVNFRDMEHRRVVTSAEVEQFMRRQPKNVRVSECCMTNCFGLKQIYNFLNIPFLRLKRQAIEEALVQTKLELAMAEDELNIILGQDYDAFVEAQETRRASLAKAKPPPKRQSPVSAASPSAGQRQQVETPPPTRKQEAPPKKKKGSFFSSLFSRKSEQKPTGPSEAELRRIKLEKEAAMLREARARAARGEEDEEDLDSFVPEVADDDFFGDDPAYSDPDELDDDHIEPVGLAEDADDADDLLDDDDDLDLGGSESSSDEVVQPAPEPEEEAFKPPAAGVDSFLADADEEDDDEDDDELVLGGGDEEDEDEPEPSHVLKTNFGSDEEDEDDGDEFEDDDLLDDVPEDVVAIAAAKAEAAANAGEIIPQKKEVVADEAVAQKEEEEEEVPEVVQEAEPEPTVEPEPEPVKPAKKSKKKKKRADAGDDDGSGSDKASKKKKKKKKKRDKRSDAGDAADGDGSGSDKSSKKKKKKKKSEKKAKKKSSRPAEPVTYDDDDDDDDGGFTLMGGDDDMDGFYD